MKAATDRSPDVLRCMSLSYPCAHISIFFSPAKRTPGHSTAVNSGSSQRSLSTFVQDQFTPSRQSMTNGLPAAKRLPTDGKLCACSLHFAY